MNFTNWKNVTTTFLSPTLRMQFSSLKNEIMVVFWGSKNVGIVWLEGSVSGGMGAVCLGGGGATPLAKSFINGGKINEKYFRDGVHLTPEGSQMYADVLYKRLISLPVAKNTKK
jgi:hypothetical protein